MRECQYSAKEPAYSTKHSRVRAKYGKASDYNCAFCYGRQARNWAKLHGRSGNDPADYIPLCCYCHQGDYDYDTVHSPEAEAKRSASMKALDPAIYARQAAKRAGVKRGKYKTRNRMA